MIGDDAVTDDEINREPPTSPETPDQAAPEWAYAFGKPTHRGRIRTTLDDFQVTEQLSFTPTGAGEHLFLYVRKQGVNTDRVALALANFAQVPRRLVSYAGLKDRHAIAQQWFSIHLPLTCEVDWTACGDPSFTVLNTIRHSRKLKSEAIAHNAFRIVIRSVCGDPETLNARWQRLIHEGVPNYFGEQRFGRDGNNLAQAEALFRGQRRDMDRYQRGLYLSAARSYLFNQVLSHRIQQGTWNQALSGDVLMLDGRHSCFPIQQPEADIVARVAHLQLHPTGPLWGSGDLLSQGDVQALEYQVAAAYPLLKQGLEKAGLKQERRALRVRLAAPDLQWLDEATVVVQFVLPTGVYATTVLREWLCYQSG